MKILDFFSIFVGQFCPPGSGSAIWMRIRIQQLKYLRIHANPDPDTDPDPKPWLGWIWKQGLMTFDHGPVAPSCAPWLDPRFNYTQKDQMASELGMWKKEISCFEELSDLLGAGQCSGSVTLWYGSGFGSRSSDPYFWLTDPYPALFVSDLQNANKKYFFSLHHSSKIKSHKEVTKQ